jgi:hypothetical protein
VDCQATAERHPSQTPSDRVTHVLNQQTETGQIPEPDEITMRSNFYATSDIWHPYLSQYRINVALAIVMVIAR